MDSNEEILDAKLQDAFRVEPPESLRARLLAIAESAPERAKQRGRAVPRRRTLDWLKSVRPAALGPAVLQWRLAAPAFAVAAAIAVLWVAGISNAPDNEPVAASELTEQQQQEALQDFITVMRYLNASTARAHRGVQSELGTGLMTAFERGEQSFKDSSNRVTNGG